MRKKNVFVVHGRNTRVRNAVFDFLLAVGLHPIEWSEARKFTRKPSPYVGEILDAAFSKAQAVVVIFTPEDMAYLHRRFRKKNDPSYETKLTPQVRPNVLFEAGIAMGRDDERTIFIQFGEIRPFSDIGGRHIIKWEDNADKRTELAERLESAGCIVNLNGRKWLTAGNFGTGSEDLKARKKTRKRHKTRTRKHYKRTTTTKTVKKSGWSLW